jgi:hypothetical protein
MMIPTGGAAWAATPTPDEQYVYIAAQGESLSGLLPAIPFYLLAINHLYPSAAGHALVYSTSSLTQIAEFDTGIFPGSVEFPSLDAYLGRGFPR